MIKDLLIEGLTIIEYDSFVKMVQLARPLSPYNT